MARKTIALLPEDIEKLKAISDKEFLGLVSPAKVIQYLIVEHTVAVEARQH